jgi:hypothetical protein
LLVGVYEYQTLLACPLLAAPVTQLAAGVGSACPFVLAVAKIEFTVLLYGTAETTVGVALSSLAGSALAKSKA